MWSFFFFWSTQCGPYIYTMTHTYTVHVYGCHWIENSCGMYISQFLQVYSLGFSIIQDNIIPNYLKRYLVYTHS